MVDNYSNLAVSDFKTSLELMILIKRGFILMTDLFSPMSIMESGHTSLNMFYYNQMTLLSCPLSGNASSAKTKQSSSKETLQSCVTIMYVSTTHLVINLILNHY